MSDKKVLLTEMDLPEGRRYDPPEGIPIIQPFKELTQFYPCQDPEQYGWADPFEARYTRPLALNVARVFGVPLIDDQQYLAMTEDQRATYLSCCLTRADIQSPSPGIFVWPSIVVVAKYCIVVAIETKVDVSNGKITIPKLLLWSNRDQAYAPVCDPTVGHIQNPAVILQVLSRYARMERLV